MEISRKLQLLVKVTRQCNLRCGYCNDWRAASPTLSLENFERLCKTALNDTLHPGVVFVWHGGEPTLVPVDYYEEVLQIQGRNNVRGKQIVNVLQTNAAHLSNRWIDFLKRENLGLSISLDGPDTVHGNNRPTVGGRSSFPLVVRTMQRLKSEGIPFGVLFVLSEELLALGAKETWKFIEEMGIEELDFVPARPPNLPRGVKLASTIAPQFVTNERWTSFMQEIFDVWWDSGSTVRVKMLDSVMSRLIGADPELCLIGGGCFGTVFSVEPEGHVNVCDVFHGEELFQLGELASDTFETIAKSARLASAIRWNEDRLKGLSSCDYFALCNGGCPHDAVIYESYGARSLVDGCCGWAPLFEHVGKRAGAHLIEASGSRRLPILTQEIVEANR
jgi:uncharacterized protein